MGNIKLLIPLKQGLFYCFYKKVTIGFVFFYQEEINLNNKCIEFKSSLGNEYIYDDITGHIFYKNEKNINSLTEKYRNIKPQKTYKNILNITAKDIQEYLINYANGFKQLILEVTSECNLPTHSEIFKFKYVHFISPFYFSGIFLYSSDDNIICCCKKRVCNFSFCRE